ncbi:Putative UDP-glucuronosyl/UDP-glucosyltransferase [Septoria linicola]|uniref:UDP-glucuronosyl/UDP-glucosyltransferase n=1 Tax=Septoria linicola TaxID=215465 RepID=A0A9Q9ANZ9_9PEZI|nr:putative UDP-glucuronosyl/UDP-glucosyltransferase [Septoria linicola]USW50483.1 Putative UDP-glucuronosyl/UDP-glucosyltransferase [Septoria linicola]
MQATRRGPNNLVLGTTNGDGLLASVIPAGVKGIDKLCTQMQILLDPWTPEDHFSIYKQILAVIDEVDPAVVVLDTLFFPGVEAARTRNRVHAIISPNLASDTFGSAQPRLGMLWKYPALGSGYPFPVPLTSILPNIYLNMRIIGAILRLSYFSTKCHFLKAQGIQNAMDLTTTYRPDVPWITQTLPAAAFPLDIIPPNVTLAGPILLSTAPAHTQDPELMMWIDRAPTILINLGTLFTYSIIQAHQMAAAIEIVLQETPSIQVLWKLTPSPSVKDRINPQTSSSYLKSTGRVKVVEWFTIDPAALLVEKNIIAVVTHGGAGGYHEAIASGVPQVVVPLWADLYNFAQLAESRGVGVWACREMSPEWSGECLAEAILNVVVGQRAREVRRKADEMRKECERWGVGRDVAGDAIAGLARSGR